MGYLYRKEELCIGLWCVL